MPLLWAILVSLAILTVMAAGYTYERLGQARDSRGNPAPGRLVSVGDHKLHLLCKGSAAPSVVIEQGAGSPSALWWPIQERVSAFAGVCTYDRAGYGWSEPVARPRTIQERAEELHALLTNAGVPGPYILVAHSYGGLIVRWFAHEYADEVAGIVLVDSAEESSFFTTDVLKLYSRFEMLSRVMAFTAQFGLPRFLVGCFPELRDQIWFVKSSELSAMADDLASLKRVKPALRELEGFGTLKDLPLIVLVHGQPFPGPFALLEKFWSESQKRLAALSTNSELVVAEKSNHMIHLDQPDLVVDAIRRVHAAVHLPQNGPV